MKYKIELEVEVDPTIIQVWPDYTDEAFVRWVILHDVTGDTYETMDEMFQHQMVRNVPPGMKILNLKSKLVD